MIYAAQMGFENPNTIEHDYDSGNHGFSRYYQPLSYLNQQPEGRLFFFNTNNNNNGNNNNNFRNPFFKTATFTLTSTLTLVSVQSCVPATQFVATPPPACRRKRDVSADEDVQFPIIPSQTQQ